MPLIHVLDNLHERDLGSVADALPWAHVYQDGIVMTKHGGLLSSWSFTGPDMESASEDETDYLSERVKEALDRLASIRGWSVFVNLYRIPSTEYPQGGWFPSRIGRLIDHERFLAYKAEGAHYESRYVLSLCYHNPSVARSHVEQYFMRGSGISEDTSALLQVEKTFAAGCDALVRSLEPFLSLRPLRAKLVRDTFGQTTAVDEHLSFLYYCLTGDVVAIRVPDTGFHVDAYLADRAMKADFQPQFGARHIAIVGINGLPARSLPGLFRGLDSFAQPLRVSMRSILLDKKQGLAELRNYERTWAGAAQNFVTSFVGKMQPGAEPTVSTEATLMEADARRFYDRVEMDQLRVLFFTFNAVLFGPTYEDAAKRAQDVVAYLQDLHFVAQIEGVGAPRAVFGSLPGDVFSNVQRPPISTRNLAHFMPLTGIWPGIETHPSKEYPRNSPPNFYGKTTGTAPFRFCTNAMDSSGHTLLVGSSGGGKSTFLGFLLSQFERYSRAQAVVIDRGHSQLILAKAMELDGVASYYDLGAGHAGVGFCPFAYIDESQVERDYATSFVETLMRLSDQPVTVEHRRYIQEGIKLLAGRPDKTLTTLMTMVPDQTIKDVIQGYLTSIVGDLLDHSSDMVSEAPFLFFETESLASVDDRWKLPVLTHIIHLTTRLAMVRPMLFVIDEAWTYFKDPFMSKMIHEFLKLARRRNCAVIAATQSLQDIDPNSPLGSAMLSECLTKVFLPNPGADRRDADVTAYKNAGLSDYEIYRLANELKRANDYYYTSPVGRRPFSLDLKGVARTMCASTSGNELVRADELMRNNPTNWVSDLLEEHGLADWGETWKTLEVGNLQ